MRKVALLFGVLIRRGEGCVDSGRRDWNEVERCYLY